MNVANTRDRAEAWRSLILAPGWPTLKREFDMLRQQALDRLKAAAFGHSATVFADGARLAQMEAVMKYLQEAEEFARRRPDQPE